MSDQYNKNIVKYVVPTMLSSVCFFLFTIVDGVFIGHGVGTNGLGAINLVMPFVMVVNAVFMLTTIGGVTIAAIRLGRGDKNGANQAFMHSVLGSVAAALILCVAGVFFADPICTLLGASGTFHEMAAEYLFWYSLFIIPSALNTVLMGFCRNDGSPVLVSVATIISTACNIFGDWLLIFPIPMGLKGAAAATGVSQVVSLFIVLTHFVMRKGDLYFHMPKFDGALFKKIAVRGLPESISQLATPVMTLCMNMVLVQHIGDIGVNAFSIISYVASFSIAVFLGSSEGLQPLFGQSYGAKQEKELKGYFHAGLLINFIGSLFINVLLLFAGKWICALFGADQDTLEFAVKAMPMFAWGFVVMSLNVMISAYLYSTKRSKQAVIINVLRSLVVNSIVILLLPAMFGGSIIWFTFGIYEGLVLVVSVVLLRNSEKNGIVYQ